MSGDIKKQSNKLKVTPGWSEHVRPYSEESKFWFATWKSAGSPSEGELYNLMLYTKRQYRYAIRRLKGANDRIQND